MDKVIDKVREWVKAEDPLVWLSLFIASIITFLFYIFVLVYTRFY